MKELSTEEKAKAYDEIIVKAEKMHNENCDACKACIEELIPKLAKSEDERIRKAIIGYIHHDQHYGVSNEEMVAWLEKQSEQKPSQRMIAGAAKEALFDYSNADIPQKDFAEKQNPIEWSEEDTAIINRIIAELEKHYDLVEHVTIDNSVSLCSQKYYNEIEWLKALKPWYK